MKSSQESLENRAMNLDKKKKYVVACSFGPDSMALLDMMKKENYNLVVAHVNYHKRKESDFEEQSLKKYCELNNLKCFVLDTSSLKVTGNFQEWARKVRYEFFKKVLLENKCDAVVVAHQEDDLIETYLMQKSKKSFVAYYGIEKETVLFGVRIIRPLLYFKKSDLEKYDIQNNVPYSVDWTNLTDLYTRNKYRHEIVEKLTDEERKETRKEIDGLNKNKENQNIADLQRNIWELPDFLRENPEVLVLQISNNLQKRNVFKKITKSSILGFQKSFQSSHANIAQKLIGTIYLVKSYSKVYLLDFSQFSDYEYVVDRPGDYEFEFVSFGFDENMKDRNLTCNDFPLKIRPVNSKEKYKVGDHYSEVRRLFIDWKMPHFLRGWWPGIYNKNGELVYIPRYRETYTDKHLSKFIIKFPQF